MRLGILVNTDRHLDHVIGITEAAVRNGHRVYIFVMDDGIRLLGDDTFIGLIGRDGTTITYCEFSAGQNGIDTDSLPPGIIRGSQYDNAVMHHRADRAIVL